MAAPEAVNGATGAGTVAVVVLNWNNAALTIECLGACQALDWPTERLQLVVVDNGSVDPTEKDRIARAFPDVELVASPTNRGFAGGANLGAARARSDYVAFLNNDARPDPAWLRAAVDVLEGDASVACVASKVLDWEGKTVDFVDAALSFYGHGFKLHVGAPDSSSFDFDSDVLFASGAAMVMRTEVFRAAGGFDEDYFAFFEDVDLGWRLWLLGHRVRYVPASLVYHRHHATMSRYGRWRETYLLERNALFTIYKNYDDANLAAILPAALALAVRRGVVLGGDDPTVLDLARVEDAGGEGDDRLEVAKETLAPAYAVNAFVEALPRLDAARRALQAARRRTDQEILRLFRLPFRPNLEDERFTTSFDAAVEAFGVRHRFGDRHRIVVATGDALTPKMAGPAIRAWHMAAALAAEHDVELVTVNRCEVSDPRFPVRHVDAADLQALEAWCDVFVFQGFLLHEYPFLRGSHKVVVVDVYDPFHLEQLEQRDNGEAFRRESVRSSTQVLNEQLLRGDFFLCASSKQRDFWLGQMTALGRVNPLTYDEDETLESLITVLPFGISDRPPVRARPAIKGVVEGIAPGDRVILWGGGIYNWFDPLTLLHAVDKLRNRCPDVRLFFLGLRHPNPHVPEFRMAVAAQALSEQLGLTGTHVFFNEDWVEFDDRQNYLLEADVGVSTHLDHVETAFSFRTRILDYLWAGLPVVATGGDALAELITSEGLGLTVAPGDIDGLEAALFRILDDEEFARSCRQNMARVAPRLTWSQVLQPLIEFCRRPRRAPDLLQATPASLPVARRPDPETPAVPYPELHGWARTAAMAVWTLRHEGVGSVVRKTVDRVTWMLTQGLRSRDGR
jgi:GT2 family glycosyltransferase/glycosyltransferase involved in cell wall biosynthesis